MKSTSFYITLLIAFSLLFLSRGNAQVSITDPAFRAYVITDFSAAWDMQNQTLDTTILKDKKNDKVDGTIYATKIGAKEVDQIIYFERIDTIFIDSNYISSIPNINRLSSVNLIDLSFNQFVALPDLHRIPALENIQASNNQLDTLDAQLGKLGDSLQFLNVSNNQIRNIGHVPFQSMPALSEVDVRNNFLSFEDITPFLSDPDFESKYKFFPQKKQVLQTSSYSFIESQTVSINIGIDQFESDLTYHWYFNGELLKTTTSPVLNFQQISFEDAGTYSLSITSSNDLLKNGIIETTAFLVSVDPCQTYDSFQYHITNNDDCDQVALSLEFTNLSNSPNEIIVYGESDSVVVSNLESLELKSAFYHIRLGRPNTCHNLDELNFTLLPCSSYVLEDKVITPNGDGLQDYYRISDVAKVKVFDIYGNLVSEFTGPTDWYGTSSNGSTLPPGYYLLSFGEKEEYLTIHR